MHEHFQCTLEFCDKHQPLLRTSREGLAAVVDRYCKVSALYISHDQSHSLAISSGLSAVLKDKHFKPFF